MLDILADLVRAHSDYMEVRHHRRVWNYLRATNGRVDFAKHSVIDGVGVRALVAGAWGFVATTDCSAPAISHAIGLARSLAAAVSRTQSFPRKLARANLATADIMLDGYEELTALPIDGKLDQVVRYERELAEASRNVISSECYYSELIEEKHIVTSDGACARVRFAQPEFSLNVTVERNGECTTARRGAGINGGWRCLLQHPSLRDAAVETVKIAVDLGRARHPDGGEATLILTAPIVGLLCHEAVGHIVEADSVRAGSVAKGRLGQIVASPLVTLCDSGQDAINGCAVGTVPFDDEGVTTSTATIVERGILRSYLHNRETAEEFDATPTGNARAWLFNDEPRIRMRNTYMLPGDRTLEDMIAEVEDGYLADGPGDGQADANGEFMFGTDHLRRIRNGKVAELVRDATLSGMAFDVLASIDAVSREFRWDLGTGCCTKGQPAKVDAGGPSVRCRLTVGGR